MIRKAVFEDIDAVAEIYADIHTEEEAGRLCIGWERGVYPERQTALTAFGRGELFVSERDGKIVAAAVINQRQVPEYADCAWEHPAPDDRITVLHTLVVAPHYAGMGVGTEFVRFYESYAMEHGCPYLRMDTNVKNSAARALYRKLGYSEPGIVHCVFNGIAGVSLVCLEKCLE